MKNNKTPEFPPDLLASIAPEKREEFKKIARKKRYLSSGLFLFFWHLNLWGLSFPIVWVGLRFFSELNNEVNRLFSNYGAIIISFFVAIILSYLTKSIRTSLNQIGINVTHGLTISFVLLYGIWWWSLSIPARGY